MNHPRSWLAGPRARGWKQASSLCLAVSAGLAAFLNCTGAEIEPSPAVQSPSQLAPGVVIDYSPATKRAYIGSPSLAVLPDGDYVASHDFFGPGTSNDRTVVFESSDRGRSWQKVAEVKGQWWSTLFVHDVALYLLGTSKEYGDVVIRRSDDNGKTWTTPTNGSTGRLRHDGQYHCAPTPILQHSGRLWRGLERREPPIGWGVNFRAGVISAPAAADLLDSANWTFSNFLAGDTNWLSGSFGGWLEGNMVEARDGRLLDILRVDTTGFPEKAALVNLSADGRVASFDPNHGFIDFPGGAKKFTIRYDPSSDRYWSLSTAAEPPPPSAPTPRRPAALRNTLALISSSDLTHWRTHSILLHHPDPVAHGFQYVDWLFDGEDIIAACRTAFDDTRGGAHNHHDANFLTFHRFARFRNRTQAQSEPLRPVQAQPGRP